MTLVCNKCGEKKIERRDGSSYCRNGCQTVTAQPRDGISNFMVRTRDSLRPSIGGGARSFARHTED